MTGMLTGDRMVRLEVTGMCQQNISRSSNYSVTVPYNSMSPVMKNIMRMGGKVTGVYLSDRPAAVGIPSITPPKAETPSTAKKSKKK
jgi:hypothetical protein